METMKINTHTLKLQKEFCDHVNEGLKPFEIRLNDRGYQKGDLVQFKAQDGFLSMHHSINNETFVITYVLSGYGLKDGYVVFGIKKK